MKRSLAGLVRTLRRPSWPAAGFLAMAIVLAIVRAESPMPAVHGDGYYTYLWARTIVVDHDFSFARDYRECPDPWQLTQHNRHIPDVNYWNLGPALFWAPILAIEHAVSPHEDARSSCDGRFAERAVLGSMLAGLLTALLGYLTARLFFDRGVAFFGAAGMMFCSALFYYSTMMLSYGHAASSFGVALFVWLWARNRDGRTWRGWAALGSALGLATLMRTQDIVVMLLPFADWLLEASVELRARAWRSLLDHVIAGALFVAMFALVFAPQLLAWHTMTGHWLLVAQGDHYMRWGSPRLASTLFAQGNGLLTWSPVHYVALAGLVLMAWRRETRAFAIGMLVSFVACWYVAACVWDWWASTGYPGRRFDMVAAPMMVGLAAFADRALQLAKRWPARFAALVGSVAVILGGVWSLGTSRALAHGLRTDVPEPSPAAWDQTSDQGAHALWMALGNPLAYPASIPFALRYGVHPRRWDVVGGPEFFYHDHLTLARDETRATLVFTDPAQADYLDGTFEREVRIVGDFRARVAQPGRARILLPLHWPEVGALEFEGVAEGGRVALMSVTVNGVRLAPVRFDGEEYQRPGLVLPRGCTHEGINEIYLDISGAPVGLYALELIDTTPSPEELQRVRDGLPPISPPPER